MPVREREITTQRFYLKNIQESTYMIHHMFTGLTCTERIAGLFSHALLFEQVRLLQGHIQVQLRKDRESERESEVNGVCLWVWCLQRASVCVQVFACVNAYTSACMHISIHRRTNRLCACNCNGHAFVCMRMHAP